MLRSVLPAIAAATLLAACGSGGPGTTVSITTNDAEGNVLAAADSRSGEVKVDLPGFNGTFKLPKLNVAAGDFDLNGVKLYPDRRLPR